MLTKLGGCEISKYLILSKIENKKLTLTASEEEERAESMTIMKIVAI